MSIIGLRKYAGRPNTENLNVNPFKLQIFNPKKAKESLFIEIHQYRTFHNDVS